MAFHPLRSGSVPDKRVAFLVLSFGLTVAFLAVLIPFNAHYLFHLKLYGDGDIALNSLSVLRAKHFQELYGQYSRWGFHHPGPATFYAYALAEVLLYDTSHLVPTPYNAHEIMQMILACSFFAAGICMAARWVRSALFIPLALLVAALHLTAVNPFSWLLFAWLAYSPALIFFGMSVAAASVGAGQGDDLPMLVLAGGLMLNSNVAQPLFVGPLCLLAYAGLTWACVRRQDAIIPSENTGYDDAPRRAVPWRLFPRAHGFAAVLAVAFLLPMIVDLCLGSRSNFAQIIHHMRTHRGEHHPWLDSLYCFLRFGAYTPTHSPIPASSPDNVTLASVGQFLRRHSEMTFLWLGALLVPVLALALRLWSALRPVASVPVTQPLDEAVRLRSGWRGRFLGWLAAVWLLSVGLVVFWGHIEDGKIYYYTSWFTYSIYYVLALLAAGCLSDIAENLLRRTRHPVVWTGPAAVACVLAAAGYVWQHRYVYRAAAYDNEIVRATAHTVFDALDARPDAPRAKLLLFPDSAWESTAEAADWLARGNHPYFVIPRWGFVYRPEHVWAGPASALLPAEGQKADIDLWRIVPADTVDPGVAARHPMGIGYALLTTDPELDPAAPDASISFVGEHHNSGSYVVTGWSPPEDSVPFAWSTGKEAAIRLTPKPVPANSRVEIDFSFVSAYLPPGKRHAQRLVLNFNGSDVGVLAMDTNRPAQLRAFIPAALWNKRSPAVFVAGFPDAISPLECGENEDARQLAFATEKITFHLVDATAPSP